VTAKLRSRIDVTVSAEPRICPNSGLPIVTVTDSTGAVIRVFCSQIDQQTGICRRRSSASNEQSDLVDCDFIFGVRT
jgi:hypothetical protein